MWCGNLLEIPCGVSLKGTPYFFMEKSMHRKKVTTYALLSLVMCLVISITTAFSLLWQPLGTVHAERDSANFITIGSKSNDLYDDTQDAFDFELLKSLCEKITGDTSLTYSELLQAATVGKTSQDIRDLNEGKNITVWFGGRNWDITYLTKSPSEDVIVTLWMDADDVTTIAQYQGWYDDNPTDDYPANMYSTSKIRVVTLNAGGEYAKSGSELTNEVQSTTGEFARFTSRSAAHSLIDYIMAPGSVGYQETEFDQATGEATKDENTIRYFPNDAYGVPKSGGSWKDNYDYASHGGKTADNYSNWKYDYLWLPSITETGCNDTGNGIWKTDTYLRNSISKQSVDIAWLRSGSSYSSRYACGLGTDAGYVTNIVSNSQLVRPALHLNLTKAIEDTCPSQPTGTNPLARAYDGTALSMTINGYDSDYMDALNTPGSTFLADTFSATNAGTYTLTITPKWMWSDKSRTEKQYTLQINKANYTGSATITLNANLEYDGSNKTATLNNSYQQGIDNSTPTASDIHYVSTDGVSYTSSTIAPVNAGTYTASVTFTAGSTNYNAPAEVKQEFTITPANITENFGSGNKFSKSQEHVYHADGNKYALKLPEANEAEFPLSLVGKTSLSAGDVTVTYIILSHEESGHAAMVADVEQKITSANGGDPSQLNALGTWTAYSKGGKCGTQDFDVDKPLGYCVIFKAEAENHNTLYGYFSVHIFNETLKITLTEDFELPPQVEYGEITHTQASLRTEVLKKIDKIEATNADGSVTDKSDDLKSKLQSEAEQNKFRFYFRDSATANTGNRYDIGSTDGGTRLAAGKTYYLFLEYIDESVVEADRKNYITFEWYQHDGTAKRPSFTVVPRKINVELTVNGGGTYKQTPTDTIAIGTPTRSGAGNWYGEASEPQGGLLEFLKITYTYVKKNGGYSGALSADMPAGDYSITAASANGDYDVTFTFAEGKDTYTVAKATPSVTPQFTTPEHLYTSGSLPTLSYASADGVEGTIAWDQYTLEAGRKSYGWTFTPDDEDNYNKVTGTSEFSVESVELKSISAQFEQGENVIYTTDTLDSLKQYLTVKGTNNDGSDYGDITEYSLTGSLNAGSSSIIVSYGGFTTTFTVTVTPPTTPEPDNPPTTDPEPDDPPTDPDNPSGGTGDSGNEGSGDNGSANNNGSLDGGDVGPLVVVVGVEAVMLVALIAAVVVLRKR